ncbi:FAD-dependent oxidoreductase [Actinomadura flavalba]|uniref:FAD-dependent oxidoreductase n=1 Tax=Actinomadura flavalba TaxID=1120938 RepID=UPI00037E1CE9|nr:FAD-dependent oxidoreductase [Actinomadura flavalba]
MRVGIAGGGIAGLTVAWLLGEEHECVLLEARSRVGGSARSFPVRLGGETVAVELGSQDISAEMFPRHRRLLSLLGYTAADVRRIPASLSLTRDGERVPSLVTPAGEGADRPSATRLGPAWDAVNLFLDRAAEWHDRDVDWCVPLAELVEPLPVSDALKRDVLYARPASLFCCDLEEAKELSARAAIAFYVGESADPPWEQLAPGLESLAWALAADTPRLRVRTGAALERVRRTEGRYELTDSTGVSHLVDEVVFAVPPPVARDLVAPLAGTAALCEVLGSFAYVDTAYALHLDPAYMPADERHWATTNLSVHDGWCESCDWYGPVHGVDVFKSQIAHREVLPDQVLCRADFRHLMITPGAVRAQRRLAGLQGRGGLHFAGNHTNWVASQESAVTSAIDVAGRIAPDAPRMTRLTG